MCGNNNSGLWLIIILIILFYCGGCGTGWGCSSHCGSGCDNNCCC